MHLFSSFKQSHRLLLTVVVVLLCLLIGPVLAVESPALSTQNPDTVIKQLTSEFQHALPVEIKANGEVKRFELVAKPTVAGLIPPYQLPIWAYNDQTPGPVLRVNLGDTVEVLLKNELPQATTIHWHGVRVPNAMDGVPGVTQAPIAPGDSFLYRFIPKDAGTFWFHPHQRSAEQIERGLYGVLIVDEPQKPAYSQDLLLVLDDWLLESKNALNENFVSRHDLSHDGRWGNLLTVNSKVQPELTVRAGERIRLRLINVANGRVFAPQLPGLSANLIAVDGLPGQRAVPLQGLFLAPGNRVDLDVVIPSNAGGQTFNLVNTLGRKQQTLAAITVATESAVTTPRFAAPKAQQFPNWNQALNAPINHEFMLDASSGGQYGIQWTIDDLAWPHNKSLSLKAGRFYRLRFNNRSPRLHPMHLHGQFFQLLARNGQAVQEGFWRDTILLQARETIDIGLVPQDRGRWANHCHILEHAAAGMMTMIEVK